MLLTHLRIVSFAPNLSLCTSVGPVRPKIIKGWVTCLKVGCFVLNLLKTSVSSQTKDGTSLRFLDSIAPTRRHVAGQVKRDYLAWLLCQYLREEWPFSHFTSQSIKISTGKVFFYGENTWIKKNKNKVICSVNEESKQTGHQQASTCLLIRHLAAFRPYRTAFRHVELAPEIGKICNINLGRLVGTILKIQKNAVLFHLWFARKPMSSANLAQKTQPLNR